MWFEMFVPLKNPVPPQRTSLFLLMMIAEWSPRGLGAYPVVESFCQDNCVGSDDVSSINVSSK